MKITKENYPLINGVAPKATLDLEVFLNGSKQKDEYLKAKELLLDCKKYRILTLPILKHIEKTPKIQKQLFKLVPQAKIEPAWYIFKSVVFGSIRIADDLVFHMVVQDDRVLGWGGIFTDLDENESAHYELKFLDQLQVKKDHVPWALFVGVVIPTFIEFAEIETLVLNSAFPGHRKIKTNEDKYITDFREDIEIIDSSWYRTLIHDGDFNVSGHFRLQPCGPLRQSRKLIWIKDFVKHQYHRTAKIERNG